MINLTKKHTHKKLQKDYLVKKFQNLLGMNGNKMHTICSACNKVDH